jgi:hypothetical protein
MASIRRFKDEENPRYRQRRQKLYREGFFFLRAGRRI